MLVTPLVDGMNLVAEEYVAVQRARGSTGVLLLSELIRAAAELKDSLRSVSRPGPTR